MTLVFAGYVPRSPFPNSVHLVVFATQVCALWITAKFSKKSNYNSSRSFKVIDLGANRKRICDFLLVIWTYLLPLWRNINVENG